MEDIIREEARLVILRLLHDETDGRLNSSLLQSILEAQYGINRPRHWVHGQIRYLEELGAVKVAEAHSILVSEITRLGADHVERRTVLEGVKRPARKD